ncbi:MAG: 50S ribosomal protein L3 [Deltaproteobacteria bacterium]|nr:50S ribosomal protein L3 [Deltaproteobacteria bacterium]
MAWRMGLLGKKVGMTQAFDEKGTWKAFTVIEVGPCVIVDKRTEERDGYSAIVLAFDDAKPTRVNKPQGGLFAKANTTPKRLVREMRLPAEDVAQFAVGQTLTAEQVFGAGDVVDVTGVTRGKGFQGVMKRYGFRGFRATHGTHEYFRHGGSIGCRLTPGRVFKGKKMPGHMGSRRVTVQNLRVNEIVADKNLVLIPGAVPGSPDTYLTIRLAAKRQARPFSLRAAPANTEPAAAEAEA